MYALNLIKERLSFFSKRRNYHFPVQISKKQALAAINKARIRYSNDCILLYLISYDLQSIAENGYVIVNRRGFCYDYSEFI